ncbi:MAG TPA: glycoside hydrolase family 2 TIM barrel-domain containing protein [Solirubrobacteraceae bacterium]|nr:glycoside hydrolase family 2 TIM barrel-domain containing protein [Solirubrobacteraceae bacterium]
MRRSRPLALAVLAVAAVVVPAASAGAQATASTPSARTLYEQGPSGRYLMDGTWLFRRDPTGAGLRAGWMRRSSAAGWSPVTVPDAWNARDFSAASFRGGVGWYRKDFRLPTADASLAWIVRFESVNYHARVWLNGRPVGGHDGAYLPFELRLPPRALRRRGVNRLVVRVDSRRGPADFPPSRLSSSGAMTGGWWNYGGLLREVYLRRVQAVDMRTVMVRPHVSCPSCAARVEYRVTLANLARTRRRVRVTGRLGGAAFTVGTATVRPGRPVTVRRSVRVAHPRLWSPDSPFLYDTPLEARSGGRLLQRYTLKTGIRSVTVAGGRLYLNGRPLSFRGVSIHEDTPDRGFAQTNEDRDRVMAWVKDVGATVVRAHYPLHPYFEEQADRQGVMLWSEIPVYAVATSELRRRGVRVRAARLLGRNVVANGNHPSVIVWSIGNELSSKPDAAQADYIARAARTARALDGTRPVGIANLGYPSAGCRAAYAPLDVLGFNEYFGWYVGPGGEVADRTTLPEYLDQLRRCYPTKALVITEFGAEANRDGPAEEKGTYAYQSEFIDYHLGVYATKPWLSGAIYWTLQEFHVRPNWEGGNPRATPPLHQKAVITIDGRPKPGYFELQRLYRGFPQLG